MVREAIDATSDEKDTSTQAETVRCCNLLADSSSKALGRHRGAGIVDGSSAWFA